MSHTPMPAADHSTDAHAHDGAHPHVMPLSALIATFVALIVFTVITVTASQLHLGAAEIWVAMGIATVKALLVAGIFMHLIFDKPFNSFLIGFSVVFAAIFVGMCLADSHAYQPEVEAYEIQTSDLNPSASPAPAAPAAVAPAATQAAPASENVPTNSDAPPATPDHAPK